MFAHLIVFVLPKPIRSPHPSCARVQGLAFRTIEELDVEPWRVLSRVMNTNQGLIHECLQNKEQDAMIESNIAKLQKLWSGLRRTQISSTAIL